jgi:lipopolysaccharide biosynthesis glycosyltransferase
LNYVIQGAFTPLPHCYNHQSTHGTAAIDEAIVVHFSGAHKPWRHNAMRHPLAQAYMNYLQGFA